MAEGGGRHRAMDEMRDIARVFRMARRAQKAGRVGLAGAAHSYHEGHRYERHRPEETVLYRVVAEHWQSFRERVETIGPLPRFVVREVEEYLRCGILEYRFIRVACEGCGFERLVSFSCKRRGFCPSCLGRRMSDGAVHLTEHVLPEVPIRQWVCSLPWGLRALVGYDRELCAEVVGAFVEELLRSLRRRAKRLFGLASVNHAFAGAVTFIQRFDSALRLNVHVHTLALDGVYVRDDTTGEPAFRALPAPTAGEVYEIAERTAKRVVATLKKRGRSVDGLCDEGNTADDFDPALAACYGAAARAPALRVVEGDRTRDDERVAVVMGFDVHAGAAIDGRDRKRVERLCRYLARPPIAQERLVEVAGGKLRYELKKAWRDGTRFVVFEPHDFLARVCAMIPPPRFHMIRFHGVLAPNAALRSHVVAAARPSVLAGESAPATLQIPSVEQLSLFRQIEAQSGLDAGKTRRKPWAWLLRHVFAIDVTVCPKCSGNMRWRAVALTPEAIAEGLARAGLSARGPPRRPRGPSGQLSLPFPR